MVAIVDYNIGNVGSVLNMIQKLKFDCKVTRELADLSRSKSIILPGVGSFDEGIKKLQQYNLDKILKKLVMDDSKPCLGICLGMQLLTSSSEEGSEPGLGFIDAKVQKINSKNQVLKVPHMGWNVVRPIRDNPLIMDDGEEKRFYFVHSYKVIPKNSDITIGIANYGGEFCAAYQDGNIFGVQFHPEKSHRFGFSLIKRFLEL